VLGREADRLAGAIAALDDAGHEIVLHGHRHVACADAGYDLAHENLSRGLAAVEDAAGLTPRGFVAPGQRVDGGTLRAVADLGLDWVLGRTDADVPAAVDLHEPAHPYDLLLLNEGADPAATFERLREQSGPGAALLVHPNVLAYDDALDEFRAWLGETAVVTVGEVVAGGEGVGLLNDAMRPPRVDRAAPPVRGARLGRSAGPVHPPQILRTTPAVPPTETVAHDVPELETTDLSFAVDDAPIVRGVDLTVPPGETLCVVGPSGAGKSTLLRLLNRLAEPTGGTVRLDGVDYRTIDPVELRARVGLVPQAPGLRPGTVRENVTVGPRLRGESVPGDRVTALLDRVDLAGSGDRAVADLSGGEAKRVAIARTLLVDPDVLLLDEPTASLDRAAQAQIEALLTDLFAGSDRTVVLVTHDEAQVDRIADRVVRIVDGAVVDAGRPTEVVG
jgi:putative ABC transport system ATP-binding protein